MSELPVPVLLRQMVECGRWPHDWHSANAQHTASLSTPARIGTMARGESQLFLYPPPFSTAKVRNGDDESWFWQEWAPPLADPARCLIIGDFGAGSDAPILLDYSGPDPEPRVIRLHYGDNDQRRWVLMAPDIETFVAGLGL